MNRLLLRFAHWVMQGLTDFLFGYDFFISYSHADGSEFPRALKRALETKRIKVCLDEDEYVAGDHLPAVTRRRIRMSSKLILVARPHALDKSVWVPREVDVAERRGMPIIVLDVNGSFSGADGSAGLRKRLADYMRIPVTSQASDPAPSDELLAKLVGSVDSLKKDDKRVLSMGAIALVLAALAVVSTVLYLNSEKSRRDALRQLAMARITEAEVLLEANRHLDAQTILRDAGVILTESKADSYPLRLLEAGYRYSWKRPLVTLRDSGNPVQEVAISSDGKLAASWSYREIQVWRTVDGRELHRFDFPQDGGAGHGRFIAFSKDDGHLYVAGDTTLSALNLQDWTLMLLWKQPNVVMDHDYQPELGLVTVLDGNTVKAFSIAEGKPAWSFEFDPQQWPPPEGERQRFVYSARAVDTDTIALASVGGTSLWSRQSGKLISKFDDENQTDYNGEIRVNDGGSRLAILSSEMRTLEIPLLAPVHLGIGEAGHLLEFVPGTEFALMGQYTQFPHEWGALSLWDLYPTGRPLARFYGKSAGIEAIAVSKNGRIAVSGSRNGSVELWNLGEASGPLLEGTDNNLADLVLSSDGKLGFGRAGDTIRLWDLTTGKSLQQSTDESNGNVATKISLSPRGTFGGVLSPDGQGFRWDLRSGERLSVQAWPEHFSADDSWFASFAESDGWLLRTYATKTGELLNEVKLEKSEPRDGSRVSGLQFSRDDSLIIGDIDGRIVAWNRAGKQVFESDVHDGDMSELAVSPENQTIAAGSRSGTISLLDVSTGNFDRKLIGHQHPVMKMMWRSEQLLVSIDESGQVRVWDAQSSRSLSRLEQATNFLITVENAQLTPSGETIFIQHRAGVRSDRNYYRMDLEDFDAEKSVERLLAQSPIDGPGNEERRVLLERWYRLREMPEWSGQLAVGQP